MEKTSIVYNFNDRKMERSNTKSKLKTILYKGCYGVRALTFLLLLNFHSCSPPSGYHFDRLVSGMITYSIPDTMEIQKDYKATVSITKALNDSILYQDLNRDDFQTEAILISSRVRIVLIDPTGNKNFEITALNTEEQLVDNKTNTVWNWNIRPKKAGKNELVLRTTVKILDELGENFKDVTVFEKSIKVNASAITTIKQFIGTYWQWLITVCIIPLIIWGYKKFSPRKNDNGKPKLIGFKKKNDNEN